MKVVVVADDERTFRDALKRLMEAERERVAVYEAASGYEAVVLARQFHPDAIVLDLAMPGCNGLEAARRIRAEQPATLLVVCSVHSHASYEKAALEAGANAFVPKKSLALRLPPLLHDYWGRHEP